ncbi:hypothetical protein [Rhizobium sp. MHM7A]|uniref:hypothetical protein n=1 Tax=Rhizobium sp. MHM7A TaxID=2583233 RepID=UPI0011061687|nr:hypothetical protein [Rhizobium sp. MHM7A]TLX15985.1 hypothetical protein FFR93_01320 [Rhizobium sp. MHM7A]
MPLTITELDEADLPFSLEEIAPLLLQATVNRAAINDELRAQIREELEPILAEYQGLDQLLDHLDKYALEDLIEAYHTSMDQAQVFIAGNIGYIGHILSKIINTMYPRPVSQIFAFCLLIKFPELDGRGWDSKGINTNAKMIATFNQLRKSQTVEEFSARMNKMLGPGNFSFED